MIQRSKLHRTHLVTAAFLLALAGCSNDNPQGPTETPEFDAGAAATDLESVVGAARGGDLSAQLSLIVSTGAVQSGVSFSRVPSLLSPSAGAGAGRDMGTLLRAVEGAGSAAVLIPAEYLGKTLVFDPESGTYIVDDARTGAPADGVRFITYALNPLTGRPVEPLVETGYIDLIDESVDTLRLRVRAVDTTGGPDVLLVDYFVDGTFLIGTTTEITLLSEGFISDGVERLEFDLRATITVPLGSTTASVEADYRLTAVQAGITVDYLLRGSLDTADDDPNQAIINLTISGNGDEVLLAVAFEGDAIDGLVAVNNVVVINIAGTIGNPVFSRPDGSPLNEDERDALREILDALDEISNFAEDIFGPLDDD